MKQFKFFSKSNQTDSLPNPYEPVVIGMIRHCNNNGMLLSTFYETIYDKRIYGVGYQFIDGGAMVRIHYMVDEGPTFERCGFTMEAQDFLSIVI